MSRSAGPGSPISFKCHRERSTIEWSQRGDHVITLTGRQRSYRPPKGSMRGTRSDYVTREYECSCGHVGWSNHVDLARFAGEKPRDRR